MNGFNLAFTDAGSAHHMSNAIQLGGASYSTPGAKLDIRNNNFHTGLMVNTNQDTAIGIHGIYVQNCNGSTVVNHGILSNVSGTSAPENIGIKSYVTNSSLNRAGLFEANYQDANTNYGVYGTSVGGNDAYGAFFKADQASGTNYGVYAEAQSSSGTNWAGYFQGDMNVNGAAYCSSGLWSGSDKRFKKDIKRIENVNDKLAKINGYTYNLNSGEFSSKNFPKGEQIGFIAQELKQVFPQLVTEDKQGYLAVNYQGMVPVLLEAIKEQQKSIQELQKQVNELKAVSQDNTRSGSQTAITLSDKNVVVLNQNQPNPFAEQTLISYYVPQKFSKAQLIFTTSDGKNLKVVEIMQAGYGEVRVFATDLSSGVYNYSLLIDNTVIETKKLIKQ